MGELIALIVALGLASLFASLPLWLAARAISEGWHSGRLAYAAKAKQRRLTL